MDTTNHGWTVIDRDAGVLSFEYPFTPDGKGTANTFTARMQDGTMLVVSPAKGLSEGAFSDLLEFGQVGAIVATNGWHHMGQPEWRARFPEARFFAAPEAAARIAKKNPQAGSFEPMSALSQRLGPNIGVRESPGTKCGETWVWARVANGHAWFTSDLLCNWDRFPGNWFLNLLWKVTKSGPGYSLFHLAMMPIIKDKRTALSAFLADLKSAPPSVVVPAHGAIMSHDGLGAETVALVEAGVARA